MKKKEIKKKKVDGEVDEEEDEKSGVLDLSDEPKDPMEEDGDEDDGDIDPKKLADGFHIEGDDDAILGEETLLEEDILEDDEEDEDEFDDNEDEEVW